jgi:predicted bacteriocin transport accessory protein
MNKRSNIFFIAIIALIIIIAILLIINIINPKKGELISLNYEQLSKKIDNKDNFILVVSQSTCSHCATYKPKLKTIAKNYNIDIYYIDYDKETEEIEKKFLNDYNLDGSTPITIFIKKGKQTNLFDRLEGDVSKEKAIAKFKKMGFIKE